HHSSPRTLPPSPDMVPSHYTLPHGLELLSTSRSIVPASSGNLDSTMTRLRRRSMMWSMCSMFTGHSRTHAPHVTQSQTTSSITALGTIGVDVSLSRLSRRAIIRSFGDSGLPVL